MSLAQDPNLPTAYAALEGSDDKRGRVFGRLILSDRAFISMAEVVVVENSHVHREEYAYYLIIDEAEVFARDRDPDHDPQEHGHGPGHIRVEAGSISFKAFVEEAWKILSSWPEAEETS